jgi:5-methylcytosine-specific restriction endonuclease McrA
MTLAFPKPERRSTAKHRSERQRKLSRAQCRDVVFRREQGLCERCKRAVTYDAWPWEDRRAQVNEKVPRSRGGDPHNPDECELLCRLCHLPGGQHAPTPQRMRMIQARLKGTK